MIWFFGVVSSLAIGAVAGRWAYLAGPARQLALLDKVARRLDLAVDPANAADVARRLVRRERAGAIGYVIALAIMMPLDLHYSERSVHSAKPPAYTPLVMVLPWVFIALATLTGRGVCAVLDARRRSDGPRLARARVPALTDYIRPSELVVIRVLVLVIGPGLAAAFVGDPGPLRHHLHPWSVAAGVGVSIVFWALAELAAKTLIALGQPAKTLTDLAWDDAIRSLEVRQLYVGAVTPAVFVIEFSLVGLDPPDALQPLLLFGSLALVVAANFLGKPASHFRRRLWPAAIDAIHPVTWRST